MADKTQVSIFPTPQTGGAGWHARALVVGMAFMTPSTVKELDALLSRKRAANAPLAPGVPSIKVGERAIRPIHTETKVLDEAKGIVRFTASDPSLDSHREMIRVAGWKFDRFQRNPVVVDSHDYSSIEKQLGKCVKIDLQARELVEDVQFAIDIPECRLAALAFKLVSGQYLRAVSVGFLPLRMASKWMSSEEDFQAAVKEMGLTAEDAAIVRTIFLDQTQLELSVCLIGANQNALAKAYKDSVLSDEDMDTLTDIGEKTISQPAVVQPSQIRVGASDWLAKMQQLTNR